METLLKRKSIRSYTGENITDEELNIILKACDAAPVGMKKYESLHLTIIQNKELLRKIDQLAAEVFKNPNMHPLYGAPTLILISSKNILPHMENVMYSNAAIMSHNIALAATNLNIGSCYIWGAVAAICKNKEILDELNLPEDFVPCAAVCLGETNEEYTKREIPERITRVFIK